MSTTELTPRPVRVSPLIKFARWSFLITGILYGAFHQSRYSRKEAAKREIEIREKPMRDAKLAEERKRILDGELKMIEEWSKPAK